MERGQHEVVSFIWVGSIGQRSSTRPAGPRFPSVSGPNVVADRCMTLEIIIWLILWIKKEKHQEPIKASALPDAFKFILKYVLRIKDCCSAAHLNEYLSLSLF